MSLQSNIFTMHIHSPLSTPHRSSVPLLRRRTVQIRDYQSWKRRRLKINHRSLQVRSQFDNLFHSMLSQFPSVNSLDLIAPALGFASGVAYYLSRLTSGNPASRVFDIGEWVLFTSPTPFNRFVMLRCPSISFEGSELLEDVNERLVKEDRHFVRLNSGRILVTDRDEHSDALYEKLVYQRLCVTTDDGGVISLDWPANLDLTEEHGLDTTLLLIPGTAEGSGDKNIRAFVCECLSRGIFPVVMNPRGCAGSPLTTARLFTAADSDDVYTAIQFINGARPWTTLVSVGWGYGANMLAKYLAEVGEKTPLIAATCIDNPFDLEEATRSSPYNRAVHHKLTAGFVDILRSNKEIFQGRAKGFDVEKALSATSLRDFEKEISMMSYGFDALEDFYKKSSTRSVVGNVKIPLLFIQNDAGTVPQFSIPRSLIAENPFTSLLLCSCLTSNVSINDKSTISWSQNLAIEWLAAVELGLLKGRHPLLKDVDVTINPSKGLALIEEGKTPKKSERVKKLLNYPYFDDLNGRSTYPLRGMIKENSSSGRDTLVNNEVKDKISQQEKSGSLDGVSSVIAEAEVDSERGQVLQTAQVVMNMLDVTMPDILTEEKKKKVLAAMGRGETLMSALQDAVPEDVREKLTTAVSGILNNQGSNLKLEGPLNVVHSPDVASGLKSKKLQESGGKSSANDLADSSNDDQPESSLQIPTDTGSGMEGTDKLAESNENTMHSENKENVPETVAIPERVEGVLIDQNETENGGGIAPSDIKEENSLQQNEEQHSPNSSTDQKITDETLPAGGENQKVEEKSTEQKMETEGSENQKMEENSTEQKMETEGSENQKMEEKSTEQKMETEGGENQKMEEKSTEQKMETEGSENQKIEEKSTEQKMETEGSENQKMEEKSTEQKMETESGENQKMEEKSTEQKMETEGGENQKMEEKSTEQPPVPSQTSTTLPPFSVSQALDAFTGIDDSTQVAVNSVFNVIENMITQLEVEKDENVEVKDISKENDQKTAPSSPENHHRIINEETKERKEGNNDNLQEEKPIQNAFVFGENNVDSFGGRNLSSNIGLESGKGEQLVSSRLSSESSENVRFLNKMPRRIPLSLTTYPYGDSFYKEYLRQYLISKMRNTESMDLDTTTALFLDYFPEEGQWKLLDQADSKRDVFAAHEDKIIEPSYVILDSEKQDGQVGGAYENGENKSNEAVLLVKNILLDSLKVEVGRRLSAEGMEEMETNLANDLNHVADSVSAALANEKEFLKFIQGEASALENVSSLHGERLIRAISLAVEETRYLRRVLPVGVIVGSSLASLRKLFNVAPVHVNGRKKQLVDETDSSGERNSVQVGEFDNDQQQPEAKAGSINNNVMVGAVTAALGASALLAQQGSYTDMADAITGSSSMSLGTKENHSETGKVEAEKSENNIVASLAEKAMSVAGPVVPTKEDGGVDQERLVAMLAEWGQKGGMLKLVGKLALLWGGLRGAASLTNKLISFLHIAERSLLQRILGFVFMTLILWTPVVVPLFPTLVQGWATNNSSKIAEFVSIVGLYVSIIILVTIWGKRIRGYENPLVQYGLDFTSMLKIQNFAKGLIGGVVLVMLTQSVNVFLGCVHLSLPSTPTPSSLDAMMLLKVFGQMLVLLAKGIVTATGIAVVEELLFRSWLPDEIAVDLGYHRGIIISGLAFSLFQRSPWAAPGLWLLSLGLAGAKERNQGSLSLPVGLRAGMIASSFILQTGGFFRYQPNLPIWVTGSRPFEPFSGIVGMSFALIFALLLYPRKSAPSLLQAAKETD